MFSKTPRDTPTLNTQNKPMFIMMSGVPCSGKSTWSTLMLERLKRLQIPLSILSADDMAFEMCAEYNLAATASNKLTYTDMCTTYRDKLEQRYQAALLQAKQQCKGIVILDRTYLSSRWRTEVLRLIDSTSVHCVTFDVTDKHAWRKNLSKRNKENPDKNITEQIIASLTRYATNPTIHEGFLSVNECGAVGEPGWENAFKQVMTQLIQHYTKGLLAAELHTDELALSFN